MSADQPCDLASSPVSSNILRLSQPTTPLAGPPALAHSVWLASSANCRWWVEKQVEIRVNLPVSGSNIDSWRLDCLSGNNFADGWSEPCLQKAGLSGPRTRDVNQTRPLSSNIGLWALDWLSQIGSSPQYGEGCMGLSFEE